MHSKVNSSPPAPPYYPFPEEKSILGVIYGGLLWADMNTATPLGARGRSVIGGVMPSSGTHSPCVSVWIHNSSNVRVYAHGGNARPPKAGSRYPKGFAQYPPSLYRITGGSCNLTLTTLVDQFQFGRPDWNMIYDEVGGTNKVSPVLTPPCDRPVLYTRGCD